MVFVEMSLWCYTVFLVLWGRKRDFRHIIRNARYLGADRGYIFIKFSLDFLKNTLNIQLLLL